MVLKHCLWQSRRSLGGVLMCGTWASAVHENQKFDWGGHLAKWPCVTCTSVNLHLVKCTLDGTYPGNLPDCLRDHYISIGCIKHSNSLLCHCAIAAKIRARTNLHCCKVIFECLSLASEQFGSANWGKHHKRIDVLLNERRGPQSRPIISNKVYFLSIWDWIEIRGVKDNLHGCGILICLDYADWDWLYSLIARTLLPIYD